MMEDTKSLETVENTTDDVIDVDLSATKRKRIRINGDNSKFIELNTSDLNIVSRLNSQYPILRDCIKEATKLSEIDTSNDEGINKLAEEFEAVNKRMCDAVDTIFDYPVSEVCCDGGSMYDPFGGSYRFEHIIDALTRLYENNIHSEYMKMKTRVEKKASTYKRR